MIYISGYSGMIGKHIISDLAKQNLSYKTIGKSIGYDIYLDLNDPNKFNFDELKSNDTVIFLASISSPDECIKNPKFTYKVNVQNTILAIRKIISKKAYVLFASSDMVYSGNKGIVDEDTQPNPLSGYGKMKLEVENYFKDELYFKSMRLSLVCGVDDNFTSFLHNASMNKNLIKIFHPIIRSMVSIQDVILFVRAFIEQPNKIPRLTNLVGSEFISKLDYALVFSEFLNLKFSVNEPPDSFLLSRPKEIYSTSKYLKEVLKNNPKDVLTELRENLANINKEDYE